MKFGSRIEENIIKKEEQEDSAVENKWPATPTDINWGAVHKENKYNDPDEGFLKQKKDFVDIEEYPDYDSDPEELINCLSDKLEKEKSLADEDKYDFLRLISGLLKSAQKKGEKEVDELLNKTLRFIAVYREILKKGLSDERIETEGQESEGQEYEECAQAFKEIFGEVIYSDGQIEAFKHKYIKPKNPKANENGYIELGNKIYYDRRGVGYLNQKEAAAADARILQRRKDKRNKVKIKF